MLDAARGWVLRRLRVPAEPRIPAGARVIHVFRAAPNYYRYRLARWALGQIGALAGLVGGFITASVFLGEISHPTVVVLRRSGEVLAAVIFLGQLVFGLALLRLDFELRWYILADRCLRIREGILAVREKTMTFANIQQISIQQNPLQRLLGIADVRVRTAGGGGGGTRGLHGKRSGVAEAMHEAYFRGVDNAEQIRGAIRERVRLHRDAGLGDPDEPAAGAAATSVGTAGPTALDAETPAVLVAARELRREMRALRSALEARRPGSFP